MKKGFISEKLNEEVWYCIQGWEQELLEEDNTLNKNDIIEKAYNSVKEEYENYNGTKEWRFSGTKNIKNHISKCLDQMLPSNYKWIN